MSKVIYRLTESSLHNIVHDSICKILENKQDVNECWKNWAIPRTSLL